MRRSLVLALLGASLAAAPATGQEPVVGAPDAEALFTSPDPKLHRNKQAAYHIQRDLLEAGHWELASRWFDMWRFVDGKADEHWDGATLMN
jgi:hypothetical protein